MSPFDLARPTYAMMLDLATKLVAGVLDGRMASGRWRGGVMNHPVFLLDLIGCAAFHFPRGGSSNTCHRGAGKMMHTACNRRLPRRRVSSPART